MIYILQAQIPSIRSQGNVVVKLQQCVRSRFHSLRLLSGAEDTLEPDPALQKPSHEVFWAARRSRPALEVVE